MREIKFRAWDYEKKVMFKPLLCPFGNENFIAYKTEKDLIEN